MSPNQSVSTAEARIMVRTERSIIDEELTLESRFGPVKVTEKNRVFFPYGLAGIPEQHHYCISDLPDAVKLDQFELLQSLEEKSLSFVVLPLAIDNSLIDRKDIEEACEALAIHHEDLLLLLITSVHKGLDSVKLSVNTRAPVMVDVKNKLAAQYIFMSNRYEVRHYLSE
ncbi:MAG: flagellar assembly factor fliW [Rickettsiales bacterium]|jgi:flagellar assembly factor FliW|nr:flagellar assembly factor fliW [Rickettsiales bacterium]